MSEVNVLVVDDDPVTRLTVKHALESAKFSVATASDGRHALELLSTSQVQLVVCDRSMPDIDGLEFCRRIRSQFSHRYVYIVLLTSHRRSEDIVDGLRAGADDYVTKPFDPVELILRLNTGRRIIQSESTGVTIFALAKLAEARDQETGAHLERVRSYCRVLAEELRNVPELSDEIDDEFVRLIYETSPLHDIGKVAVPDSILLKPGPLTNDEFEVMKTHTWRGAETLAAALQEFPNAEYLRMARDIALCHHERVDGTGYPRGIAGEEIPLCGRIVALADVYDAVTSRRVYKPAYSHEKTVKIITQQRGAQFDPAVVDAFLRTEEQFRAIRTRLGGDGCTDELLDAVSATTYDQPPLLYTDAPPAGAPALA